MTRLIMISLFSLLIGVVVGHSVSVQAEATALSAPPESENEVPTGAEEEPTPVEFGAEFSPTTLPTPAEGRALPAPETILRAPAPVLDPPEDPPRA